MISEENDEAVAHLVGWTPPEGFVFNPDPNHEVVEQDQDAVAVGDFLLARTAEDPRRTADDREAMRVIVKYWHDLERQGAEWDNANFGAIRAWGVLDSIKILASVYSSHPDYRESWSRLDPPDDENDEEEE